MAWGGWGGERERKKSLLCRVWGVGCCQPGIHDSLSPPLLPLLVARLWEWGEGGGTAVAAQGLVSVVAMRGGDDERGRGDRGYMGVGAPCNPWGGEISAEDILAAGMRREEAAGSWGGGGGVFPPQYLFIYYIHASV